jgi:hypothetical protein
LEGHFEGCFLENIQCELGKHHDFGLEGVKNTKSIDKKQCCRSYLDAKK